MANISGSSVTNVATIHHFGMVVETELDTWNQCMMMNQKRGRESILNIASVRGYACQRGVAAYAASKGAI